MASDDELCRAIGQAGAVRVDEGFIGMSTTARK